SSLPNDPIKENFGSSDCHIDRSQQPILDDLVKCKNFSMFHTWRPKARVIAPRGWLNDPMGIFETKNGTYHVGYQCNVNLPMWGNVSQCSASTKDFVHFEDYNSWKDPATIVPTQLYDIRGVFDGTVIKDGLDGYPTIIYTSTTIGPLGADSIPPENEGVETQSLAYTKDNGHSWIKLNFGANGNPVIYKWPEKNLTGFRDPFVFESQELLKFYSNITESNSPQGDVTPTGHKFLLLSGGIRPGEDKERGGPRAFLYRQTSDNNFLDWTYLGPFFALPEERKPSSEWRGGNGVNFECLAFTEVSELRPVPNAKTISEEIKLKIVTTGTEKGGRPTHMEHWPIWHSVRFDYNNASNSLETISEFSGVLDWGKAYAFTHFPFGESRQVGVGWIYEDDSYNKLTLQRGYQGAFTLFRDLFVKVVRNVHPSAINPADVLTSWKVVSEPDGSRSVVTLGQKIMPETLKTFKESSKVSHIQPRTLDCTSTGSRNIEEKAERNAVTNLVELEVQPKENYYAIRAQLDFFPNHYKPDAVKYNRPDSIRGGFRIIASEHEWTDVYYDPADEYLVVERGNSSVLSCYGSEPEKAKHRLWPIINPVTNFTEIESLNLTIIVDSSALEVHANEQTVISTRAYPWYEKSVGVSFLAQGPKTVVDSVHSARLPKFASDYNSITESSVDQPCAVKFTNVELWDGLLNSWPRRPHDTSRPSVPWSYSHNITNTLYGLWSEI
ncbi:glycosyl hydrolase, partial [Phakopsora pachyrhizi]